MPFARPAIAALVLLSPIAALPAQASSPAAWEAFRADVKKSCMASLPETLGSPTVFVEPTGTPSYGVAAIEGLSPESKAQVVYLCIYDKQRQQVEVTPAIADEFLHVVRESEREAAARQRAQTGDNRTVDEAGQE